MTELKCSAQHCMHNCDYYCCKGEILVEGRDAEKKESTCCGSFDERREGSARNAAETPDRALKVACEATNCVYNKQRYCHADHIDIHGPSAHDAKTTECATFKMK